MLREFTRDPLAGLSDLIKATERQVVDVCGLEGTLIAFSLSGLEEVNKRWGRDASERLIDGLSQAIEACASIAPADISAFRALGDDFLLFARGMRKEDALLFAARVQRELEAYGKARGLPEISLRYAGVAYPGGARTLPEAFVRLYSSLGGSSAHGAGWMESLIEKLFRDYAALFDRLRLAEGKALTDDISGLANHRAAEQLLGALLDRHHREGVPFSILFIDGDNLRQYNEMGYDHGNALIKRLGAAIRSLVRSGDSVFRWLSGDEFLVVLPGVGRAEAQRAGERLRAAIAQHSSTWTFPVTVSVGVASCPQDARNAADLIRCAARANAEAKQKGKNRVS